MKTELLRGPFSQPGEPTEAPPGSPTKIHVLTERASRRESLFHPKDNLKRQFIAAIDEDDADEEILEEALEDAEADLVG
jgi:hypothetical protein